VYIAADGNNLQTTITLQRLSVFHTEMVCVLIDAIMLQLSSFYSYTRTVSMLFPSVSLYSGCQEFVTAFDDYVFVACKIHRRNRFSRKDASSVRFLNGGAANVPVNAGRLRQLHLLHRAYGALYSTMKVLLFVQPWEGLFQ